MARRQNANAPVYEDFQPTYEWADEKEVNVLYIYVPGFTREQLKIMYVHTSRVIRVLGEKSLGNNRWSRFNQSFPVPENCEVTKIHAKFQHGILTITLPKSVIPPPPPEPKVKATPQETQKAPEAPRAPPGRPMVAETPPSAPRKEVKPTPQELPKAPEAPEAPDAPPRPKVAEAPPSAPSKEVKPTPQEPARTPPTAKIPESPKQDVRPTPQEVAKVPAKAHVLHDVPKPEKVREAIPPKASLADALKEKDDKDDVLSRTPKMATSDHAKLQNEQPLEAPQKGQVSEEAAVAKKHEKVMEKSKVKENGVSQEGKESAGESAFQKVSEKVKSEKQKPSTVARSINGIKRYAAETKQAAQGFAKMLKQEDENKQLMVNVGTAAVVIMALGAYISYSFLTKGKDEK